eukprot:327784_1
MNTIICKSTLCDSFLLFLIKEEEKAQNINPYEYQYLQHNKKFKFTKHISVELYMGLHRLIKRNKIKKFRKFANDIKTRDKHNGFKPILAKLICEILLTICDLSNQKIKSLNINSMNQQLINKIYDDIRNIHTKSLLQNAKTRMSYLNENYIIGASNDNFNTIETENNFKQYQEISQRNGLSNNKNVFKNFKFSLDINLLLAQNRNKCVYCGKSSYLYCPYCKIPFPIYTFDNKYIKFPYLKLPINIDIIRHPKEKVNVCSSVHGCVIAPYNIKMYEYPNIQNYECNDGIYLLYPSKEAIFLDEISVFERLKINKIIVIESKWDTRRWSGNKQIYKHKNLINLPHCKMRNRQTVYWRFQDKSKEYLATIEAIYYSIIDCCRNYNGQYDDLLMLFANCHKKIAMIAENRKESNNPKQSFWTM